MSATQNKPQLYYKTHTSHVSVHDRYIGKIEAVHRPWDSGGPDYSVLVPIQDKDSSGHCRISLQQLQDLLTAVEEFKEQYDQA